jgi:hypothetical protein
MPQSYFFEVEKHSGSGKITETRDYLRSSLKIKRTNKFFVRERMRVIERYQSGRSHI